MVHSPNDELITFVADDDEPPAHTQAGDAWKLLVVDDDEEVHVISRIVLRDFSLDGVPIHLLHAYSAQEARQILLREKGVSVILLDVVMETDDAGLKLVEWIRKELGNRLIRIILRTGQPGAAPEKRVITEYEINDYKSKTEITDIKLYTAITVAIRGYRDLRQTQLHKEGFEHLLAAAGEMFRIRNLENFFRGVLNQILQLLGFERGGSRNILSGLVVLPDNSGFEVVAASGVYKQSLHGRVSKKEVGRFPGLIDLFRELSEKQNPVFREQFYGDFFADDAGRESFLVVHSAQGFEELERELLLIFSANVAIAHKNLTLNDFIESSQQEIIYTLGEVVESRSHETGNHVRRVGAISALLARSVGLSVQEQANIRLAAPMHDIGKIGIPDHILQKPGALSPEERDTIKRHAEIGHSILKNGKKGVLQTAALIALTHHERWDGQGYPQGMAGAAIPLAGRIVAVADVFDALTHRRSYKPPWSPDEAFEYIADNSGTQFDPEVVRCFLNAREVVLEILEAYGEDRD